MNTPKKTGPVNHWAGLNHALSLYKGFGIVSIALSILLSVIILSLLNRNPTVIVKECEKKSFYLGKIEDVALSEDDVETFVKDFIKLRYTWDEFNPKKTIGNLTCITTKGLQEKLFSIMGSEKHSNEKGQSVSQYVAQTAVALTKERSNATFDRIITINGIPIVTRTEVELQIIRDSKTACNPFGLYVNGINEIESK